MPTYIAYLTAAEFVFASSRPTFAPWLPIAQRSAVEAVKTTRSSFASQSAVTGLTGSGTAGGCAGTGAGVGTGLLVQLKKMAAAEVSAGEST